MWVWPKWSVQKPKPKIYMKHDYLTTFSIKQSYIWFKVVKILFYHCAHTWENGEPPHGQHDPIFIACMSQYAPWMSQVFHNRIWTQLNLGYTKKQIYNQYMTNIRQFGGHIGQCRRSYDTWWFYKTTRYCLFRSKT
jgi:hypothetical protein